MSGERTWKKERVPRSGKPAAWDDMATLVQAKNTKYKEISNGKIVSVWGRQHVNGVGDKKRETGWEAGGKEGRKSYKRGRVVRELGRKSHKRVRGGRAEELQQRKGGRVIREEVRKSCKRGRVKREEGRKSYKRGRVVREGGES